MSSEQADAEDLLRVVVNMPEKYFRRLRTLPGLNFSRPRPITERFLTAFLWIAGDICGAYTLCSLTVAQFARLVARPAEVNLGVSVWRIAST